MLTQAILPNTTLARVPLVTRSHPLAAMSPADDLPRIHATAAAIALGMYLISCGIEHEKKLHPYSSLHGESFAAAIVAPSLQQNSARSSRSGHGRT